MENKTVEEIIDSKYPFPKGLLKDVTLNGLQVKELIEEYTDQFRSHKSECKHLVQLNLKCVDCGKEFADDF